MRLYFLFLLFCCSLCSAVYAQDQSDIDSLLQVVQSNIQGQEKAATYVRLAEAYSYAYDSVNTAKYMNMAISLAEAIDYPEATVDARYDYGWLLMDKGYYEQAIDNFETMVRASETIPYPEGKAKGFTGLGTTYQFQGELKSALTCFSQALEIAQEFNIPLRAASALSNLAIVNTILGNYKQSLDLHFQGLEIYNKLGNSRNVAFDYINIGMVYYHLNNLEQALKYYLLADELLQQLSEPKGIYSVYTNITQVFTDQGDYDQAMKYAKGALDITQRVGDQKGESIIRMKIGLIHTREGNYALALDFLTDALEIASKIGAEVQFYEAMIGIGEVYSLQKEWPSARNHLTEGLKGAQKIELSAKVCRAAGLLASAEKELGNYEAAYEAQVLVKQMTDRLNNEELTKNITRLEAEYEFKQEKDSLNLAREKEALFFEAEIKERKNRELLLWSLFAGFLLILSVIIFSYIKIKTLNTNLFIQKQELDKINKVKSKIFSVVSHDLRSPLSALFSFVYIIKNELSVPDLQRLGHLFDKFDYDFRNVSQLLNNVLNWSIMESNSKAINKQYINAKETIHEVIGIMTPYAQTKKVQLKIQDIQADHTLYVDKSCVDFVLRNLLSNAIKFTQPEEGIITVSVKEACDKSQISVSDNGIGMSAEQLALIFKVQTNHSQKGTSGEKGSGVGLKLVDDFVKLNDGAIEVESEINVGTTFRVLLPNACES